MQPAERRAFPPAEAGALLIVVTGLVIGLCTLVGWLAGSVRAGLVAGVVLGVPAGVAGVVVRYHGGV